jgi:hypothetical protein
MGVSRRFGQHQHAGATHSPLVYLPRDTGVDLSLRPTPLGSQIESVTCVAPVLPNSLPQFDERHCRDPEEEAGGAGHPPFVIVI